MKNLIIRIVFFVIACVISITGYVAYYTYKNPKDTIAQVSKLVSVEGVGDNIKVDIYSRVSQQKINNPVFAIGELVNKSINYKKANPKENVTIDLAIYRMEIDTACYYKPGTRNYGKVTNLDKDFTDDCERISYSFIKAAKYGIKVRLIYHREKNLNGTEIYDHFQSYMNQSCIFDKTKKVSEYLEVKKSQWPLDDLGVNQMHNKQLLISDYLDYDGTEYHDAVYSATSNIDSYNSNTNCPIATKDWSHTGFTISNHKKIYGANLKYFNLAFNYYKNRFEKRNGERYG